MTRTMISPKSLNKAVSSLRAAVFLLISGVGILLFSSCKKKAEDDYYTLSKEGLRYVQLRQGKYLIYKDSATGILDSVIVTESKLEKLHSNGSGQFRYSIDYDNFSLTLTKATATGSTVWFKANALAAFSNTDFTMFSQNGNDWDQYMFRYPVSALLGFFPDDREIPVLNIEGKQYTQVILSTGKYATSSKFYWAKDVGLIRYEKGGPAPQTFTLVRNN